MRLDADGHVARAQIPVASWRSRLLALLILATATPALVGVVALVAQNTPQLADAQPLLERPTVDEIAELDQQRVQAHTAFREATHKLHGLRADSSAVDVVEAQAIQDLNARLKGARHTLGETTAEDMSVAKWCVRDRKILDQRPCERCEVGDCINGLQAAVILERAGFEVDYGRTERNMTAQYREKLLALRPELASLDEGVVDAQQVRVAELEQAYRAIEVRYLGAVEAQRAIVERADQAALAGAIAARQAFRTLAIAGLLGLFVYGAVLRLAWWVFWRSRMVAVEVYSHGVKVDGLWLGSVTGCRADHSTVVIDRAREDPYFLHSRMAPEAASRLAQIIDGISLSEVEVGDEVAAKEKIEALNEAMRSKISQPQ